jgi:hypothetical protein
MSSLPDLPDHRSMARTPEYELFAEAPPQIGKVVSVESTLKAGRRELPIQTRVLMAGLPAFVVSCGLLWAADRVRSADRAPLMLMAPIVGLLIGAIVWYFSRFSHRCTFVGESGIALFHLRGHREARPTAQVLVWSEASELRAAQTRHFYNGIYTGTSYEYRWTDAQGRLMVRLNGKYMGRDGPPKPLDPYHFAAAAEVSWSIHYLARAQEQLKREGSIAFRVDGRRVVRVGPGFMEFHFGGEPVRITADEIATVSLDSGTFAFKHKDAKWYSSAGKFNFQYGQMANGKVFFLALDKLMGYRWT